MSKKKVSKKRDYRVCPICKQEKPLKEFPGKGTQRNGKRRYSYCKPCHSKYQEPLRLKRLFNLTIEERDKIFEFQQNVCAICGKTPKSGKRLAIDHDHRTGLIRGGLCWVCNKTIGTFRDRADMLQRASDYLKDPPATKALGKQVFGRLGRTTSRVATVRRLEKQRENERKLLDSQAKWSKASEEQL